MRPPGCARQRVESAHAKKGSVDMAHHLIVDGGGLHGMVGAAVPVGAGIAALRRRDEA